MIDHNEPMILPLPRESFESSARLELVGGKGASLAELLQSALRVPIGFCVITVGFRRFLECVDGAQEHLDRLTELDAADTAGIRGAGATFRALLPNHDVPAEVVSAILVEHSGSGITAKYAVRSSATTEDLEGASFAGQHDTYLEVVGADALIARVRDRWTSLYTDRALSHRRQHGIAERAAIMAVVVQQMAESDVTEFLMVHPFRRIIPRVMSELSSAIGERLKTMRDRPDMVASRSDASVSRWTDFKRLAPVIPRFVGWMFLRRPEAAGPYWDRFIEQQETALRASLVDASPGAARLRVAQHYIRDLIPKTLMPMAGRKRRSPKPRSSRRQVSVSWVRFVACW